MMKNLTSLLAKDTEIEKSNVIICGPSGCGKTLISKTVANLLDVPFSINDATPLTQAGYVGEDVESCIHRLLQNADYNISKAEKGIIFIDEIDKLARRNDTNSPNQRDVSGEGVQQALLRMLEGTIVNVTIKNPPSASVFGKRPPQQGEVFSVDTSNILFILSGAFGGLEKIIQDRSIGFDVGLKEEMSVDTNQRNLDDPLADIDPSDLIRYGFIPEFVGRVPVIATATQLKEHELVRILVEPKNALVKQFEKVFDQCGMNIHFHEQALLKIARHANKKNTGARGLRRIMETVLQPALYEYPGTNIKHLVVLPGVLDGETAEISTFESGQEGLVDDCLKNVRHYFVDEVFDVDDAGEVVEERDVVTDILKEDFSFQLVFNKRS